jgi:hypothetical protein
MHPPALSRKATLPADDHSWSQPPWILGQLAPIPPQNEPHFYIPTVHTGLLPRLVNIHRSSLASSALDVLDNKGRMHHEIPQIEPVKQAPIKVEVIQPFIFSTQHSSTHLFRTSMKLHLTFEF